jgi:hypothetical protein
MSAYCTPEIGNQALGNGAYRVINKPIDMHDVPTLVGDAADSVPRFQPVTSVLPQDRSGISA